MPRKGRKTSKIQDHPPELVPEYASKGLDFFRNETKCRLLNFSSENLFFKTTISGQLQKLEAEVEENLGTKILIQVLSSTAS